MTENHFQKTPGSDSQKPLFEYTLEELGNEISTYENEIKAREITGAPDDWYSRFCISWLEKCRKELDNRMTMTAEEKGYVCPNDCEHCELKTTKCIVYSTEGKKKHKAWEQKKKQLIGVKPKPKLEDSSVWSQGELF